MDTSTKVGGFLDASIPWLRPVTINHWKALINGFRRSGLGRVKHNCWAKTLASDLNSQNSRKVNQMGSEEHPLSCDDCGVDISGEGVMAVFSGAKTLCMECAE